MTELQTSTLEAIHQSAKEHFLKYGYEKASLNQIVSDTGFTKGAFYGYYNSKEELFCALVQETVEGIIKILNQINQQSELSPAHERLAQRNDDFIAMIPQLVDFILDHRDEATLLLGCATGTRYENFLIKLQSQNEQHGQDIIQAGFGKNTLDPRTYHILMSGYFSMMKNVFLSELSRDEMITALEDIQHVYQVGMLSLVKEKANV